MRTVYLQLISQKMTLLMTYSSSCLWLYLIFQDIKPTEVTLMPDSIPDFGTMSQGQLKVLVEKHGVKMKSGASKETMVKK